MIRPGELVTVANAEAAANDLKIECVTSSGKARLHDTLTALRPYVIDLPADLPTMRAVMLETAARMRGMAILTLASKHWRFDELDAGQRDLLAKAAQRLRLEDDDHNELEIAAWVEGDGKDSQRIALADGIRSGLWRKRVRV